MKSLILFILISNNISLAHSPPPIDVTNSTGGKSHSGYGYYGNDDYEGFVKLRKSCTDRDRLEDFNLYQAKCVGTDKPLKSLDRDQFKALANNMVNGRLIDRVVGNAVDEIKIIDPAFTPAAGCLGAGVKPEAATHKALRREAMSLKNALSASLLSKSASQLIVSNNNEGSNYLERLQINYPYLFKPTNRFQEMTAIMQTNLGAAFDSNPERTTAHYDTMTALKAKMDVDPALTASLQAKLDEIKTGYSNYLKQTIGQLCANNGELFNTRRDSPNTIKFLHDNFKRDFQQNLIDLSPEDRAMANEYLCGQNFYYQPISYDSDCDGVMDKNDSAPNDPFAPRPNFVVSKNNVRLNPPFGTDMDYTAKLEANKVTLSKPIEISFSAGASEADKTDLTNKMKSCAEKLSQSLKTNFNTFKNSSSGKLYSDRDFEMKFEVMVVNNPNADFKVKKCWCSTCNMNYIPAGSTVAVPIPRDTCEEDFTPEMTAAKTNAVINPSENSRRWFKQEDAANLTGESLGAPDCKTVKHELMHKMGLPDEYHNENYYPFNQIGPQNSLMWGGHDIYARHFVNLLSPKACERGSQNYGY